MGILDDLRRENERLKNKAQLRREMNDYDDEVKKLKAENRNLRLQEHGGYRALKSIGGGIASVGRGAVQGLQGLQNIRESDPLGRNKRTKRVKRVRRAGPQIGVNWGVFG